MSKRKAAAGPAATDLPAYWFCVMESAKEKGDFERAAHAKRQLERLGVHVVYGPPQAVTCGGSNDAA